MKKSRIVGPRVCGKRPYPSVVSAYEALIGHLGGASPIRAYKCTVCEGPPVWHLTSRPKRPTGTPGGAGQHL